MLNQSENGVLGYHDEEPGVVASPKAPVVTFANHTCAMRLMRHPFSAIQNIFPKVGQQAVCDTVWFYYALLGRVRTNEYKGHHPLFRDAFVPVPPIAVQRRIASILSAYDDLIENNKRRIAILEEMARRIYEEWFVRYRFPGHQGVRMVESELGLVPEGWQLQTLGDLFDFVGGAQPPKSEHVYEAQPGYVRFVQNRDYGSSDHLTYIRASQRNKLCDRLDIMVDKYGDAGRVRFGIAGAYNVALAKIEPHSPSCREWLRGFLSRDDFRQYLANASQAATRPSLNPAHFRVPVARPPDDLCQRFEEQILPIVLLLLNRRDAISNLKATRDLLLPKLISGELEVSAMFEPEVLAA